MATEKRQVSIVGSGSHFGAGEQIIRLRAGQELRVEREPKNPYDANAVAVYILNQKLGYLPRGFAAEIASVMDAGFKVAATKSRDPRFDGTGVMVVEWELPNGESSDTGTDR